MRHLYAIRSSIQNPDARFVAIWVAIVVGACLNVINQGIPLLLGEPMTFGRWISFFVTPVVPFLVSCHGQGMRNKG